MIPEYPEMNDALLRIKTLCEIRSWSMYRLSKESGVPSSSINNMFHRNTQPSLETIERLCKGFGISTSDFFNTPTVSQPNTYILEGDEITVLKIYRSLTDRKKELLLSYLHGLGDKSLVQS
ncbi:MAG: helix-turn-helix domain-containing protein [Eubacterium sp.]|nr:helix-turn-helix domain-containing protein [Eubacterium sp.]